MSRPSSVGRFVRPFRGLVRPRSGGRTSLAALLPLAVLSGLLVLTPPAAAADDVRTEDAMVDSGSGADAVELDTTLYVPAAAEDEPAPAVVLAHGFGGSKQSVADDALALAERGYVVLTYSARGFGRSTGQIGLNDPRYEIADLTTLVDLLAARDDVALDGPGDPRVGVAGVLQAAGWETPGVGGYLNEDVATSTVFFTEGDETQRQAAVSLVDQFPQLTGPAPRFFELPADVDAPGLVVVLTGPWQ